MWGLHYFIYSEGIFLAFFLAKDDKIIPQNQKKVNEPFTKQLVLVETGLLHRLQAQTLSNATPPSSKIAFTLEPVMQF